SHHPPQAGDSASFFPLCVSTVNGSTSIWEAFFLSFFCWDLWPFVVFPSPESRSPCSLQCLPGSQKRGKKAHVSLQLGLGLVVDCKRSDILIKAPLVSRTKNCVGQRREKPSLTFGTKYAVNFHKEANTYSISPLPDPGR
ncbi:unnamed protein product, partial [Discosporangium mesarthrocarpum]